MKVAVEISFYPLADDFIPPIRAFIDRPHGDPKIEVVTNAMSTRLFGPYGRVMALLAEQMEAGHREIPRAVFVLKVLSGADE